VHQVTLFTGNPPPCGVALWPRISLRLHLRGDDSLWSVPAMRISACARPGLSAMGTPSDRTGDSSARGHPGPGVRPWSFWYARLNGPLEPPLLWKEAPALEAHAPNGLPPAARHPALKTVLESTPPGQTPSAHLTLCLSLAKVLLCRALNGLPGRAVRAGARNGMAGRCPWRVWPGQRQGAKPCRGRQCLAASARAAPPCVEPVPSCGCLARPPTALGYAGWGGERHHQDPGSS